MKIAVDIDDVLYRTAPASIKYFNGNFGNSLTLDDMFQVPTFEKYGTEDIGIVMSRVTQFLLNQAENLPVIDGALRGLSNIKAHHAEEIYAMTGRSELTHSVTERALERDFSGVFKEVLFTDSLNPESATNKATLCRELGIRAIIDDQLIKGLPPATRGIVFGEYPWSKILPGDVVRCRDWQEVEQEIGRIARQ